MGKHFRTGLAVFLLACAGAACAGVVALCLRQGVSVAAFSPDSGKKLIALTFDDGPKRSTTSALLDGLSQRGIRATFFLVGTNIDGNEDLVLRMEAEGHQVGVHSAGHKVLTGLNAVDFYREVGSLRVRLEELLGHGGFLLRPPYGLVDESVRRMAGCPIIQWSIDPEDWSDEDCDRQVEHILSRARDGDIILLHDIYATSVDTALRVVDALLAQGFFFVTVDELFEEKGIALADGRVYMHAH